MKIPDEILAVAKVPAKYGRPRALPSATRQPRQSAYGQAPQNVHQACEQMTRAATHQTVVRVIRHEGQVANILMYDGANGRPIFSIDSPDIRQPPEFADIHAAIEFATYALTGAGGRNGAAI